MKGGQERAADPVFFFLGYPVRLGDFRQRESEDQWRPRVFRPKFSTVIGECVQHLCVAWVYMLMSSRNTMKTTKKSHLVDHSERRPLPRPRNEQQHTEFRPATGQAKCLRFPHRHGNRVANILLLDKLPPLSQNPCIKQPFWSTT